MNQPLGLIVTLEAANLTARLPESGESSSDTVLPGPVTIGAGTRGKIILLGGLSASKSRPGDSFQARLVAPLRLDGKVVLPGGTLLGGKVVSRTPPRMLSRAGSILLVFTELTLAGKTPIPMVASVTAAQLDQRSHTKIDREGKLHGDHTGTVWMVINIAAAGGAAKAADDTIQLIVEAIVSAATDVSTAGVGRILATCVSGVFLLTRHGRDVVLPRYSEMNIVFDRPLRLAGSESAPSVP